MWRELAQSKKSGLQQLPLVDLPPVKDAPKNRGIYEAQESVEDEPEAKAVVENTNLVAVSVFNFENHNVRTVIDDNGAIWFVAKDVALALGYVRPNDAINEHCKGAAIHRPLQTAGGMQQARVLGEPNLYRLIFGSTLESAKRFQDWVFEEVLPTIRKTGKYEAPKVEPKTPVDELDNVRSALSLSKLSIEAAEAFGFVGNQAALGVNKDCNTCNSQNHSVNGSFTKNRNHFATVNATV